MKYKLWAIIFHMVWNNCLNYDKCQNLKGRIQIFIIVISYLNLCYDYIKEITYKKTSNVVEKLCTSFPCSGEKITKSRQISNFFQQNSI